MSIATKGAGVAAVIATFAHMTGTVGHTSKHVGKDVRSVVVNTATQR
jgi:hypothetical protein